VKSSPRYLDGMLVSLTMTYHKGFIEVMIWIRSARGDALCELGQGSDNDQVIGGHQKARIGEIGSVSMEV
jgi:hypothetical protein